MQSPKQIRLKHSGYLATIEPDRFIHGAVQLVVDGTPQSHVNVDNPRELFFEYIQRIGHIIDEISEPGQAITAVHLGAGALTLPRYIEETREGSRQQIIELERELVDLVRTEIPWSPRASMRFRYGDARVVLDKLPSGLRGTVDLVVVDIFSGSRTPAHVTSIEFYEQVATLLSPKGTLAVNVADGAGLAFARSQVATLLAVTPHVAALAEAQVLKGRRFGNVVLIGSRTELPQQHLHRLLAGGPHPSMGVWGSELAGFVRDAKIVTDATAVPSPPPARSIFQERR